MAAFDHAQHTTFRLLNPSARCCNTNIMSGRINAIAWVSGGQALKPSDCESACRALPECTHFSHSLTWRNCNLCHGCPWEDNGVVGRRSRRGGLAAPQVVAQPAVRTARVLAERA